MPPWSSTVITSFKSNYLAKAPPPNTIPWIRFQHLRFGGHRHSVYNTCIHKVIAKTHCVLSTRNIQVKDMLPLLREFPDTQLRAMGTASFNLAKRYVSFLSSAGGQVRRHCASSAICGARDIDSETLSSGLWPRHLKCTGNDLMMSNVSLSFLLFMLLLSFPRNHCII